MRFQRKHSVQYINKSDLQYIKKADLPKSSIPNIPKYTQRVAIPKCLHSVQWIMHEHDADINEPSCPHCHAKEKNWKLDIYSGQIFDYSQGRSFVGCLSRREMKTIWETKGFSDLVLRERKWYYDNYRCQDPKRYPELPPIPSFAPRSTRNSKNLNSIRRIRVACVRKMLQR